jgi:hypothetical protein
MAPKKKDKSIPALQTEIAAMEAKEKKKRGRPPKDKDVSSNPPKKKVKKDQGSGDLEVIDAEGKGSEPGVPSPK